MLIMIRVSPHIKCASSGSPGSVVYPRPLGQRHSSCSLGHAGGRKRARPRRGAGLNHCPDPAAVVLPVASLAQLEETRPVLGWFGRS